MISKYIWDPSTNSNSALLYTHITLLIFSFFLLLVLSIHCLSLVWHHLFPPEVLDCQELEGVLLLTSPETQNQFDIDIIFVERESNEIFTLNSEYEIFPSLFLSTISIISSISSFSSSLGRCLSTYLISSGWIQPSSSLPNTLSPFLYYFLSVCP